MCQNSLFYLWSRDKMQLKIIAELTFVCFLSVHFILRKISDEKRHSTEVSFVLKITFSKLLSLNNKMRNLSITYLAILDCNRKFNENNKNSIIITMNTYQNKKKMLSNHSHKQKRNQIIIRMNSAIKSTYHKWANGKNHTLQMKIRRKNSSEFSSSVQQIDSKIEHAKGNNLIKYRVSHGMISSHHH